MSYIDSVLNDLAVKSATEPEFLQASKEVIESLRPLISRDDKYEKCAILERLTVPDRVVTFRIAWTDDNGNIRVNRGYRIQQNNAIGPYKGGLRFHPSVNLGILKFLAFEQVFKNSLTTLPMGGAKGGSDFDPKGKSDAEVMRFCQAFMTELVRYIGPDVDVPAGDIGVGGREIGFLFGQYKRMTSEYSGVLTGKNLKWGGSLIRPEATGYGCSYFAEEMLKAQGDHLEGKVCTVSGSGNVAQYMVENVNNLGGKVVTMSDSNGTIYDPAGIDAERLEWIMQLKNVKRGRIKEYASQFAGSKYMEGQRPWSIKCDCAFPCATQNEVSGDDAKTLIKNGCKLVAEGSNMGSTLEAVNNFMEAGVLYGLGKAANAGGVATSGLEMSQNSLRLSWTRDEVNTRLRNIMINIHDNCRHTAAEFGQPNNYVMGANIAGFRKVADSMIEQGVF
ncbi:MAG: NADP-specific glutamate dehydrogenase [Candidatus Sumerlaeales bacterium]|nr:NADP-specific glutamate dehydrogenase [Candidatus Sumerlaeales bacterium]